MGSRRTPSRAAAAGDALRFFTGLVCAGAGAALLSFGTSPALAPRELALGPCVVQLWDPCNATRLLFYLFSSTEPENPELLDPVSPESQLFDPARPTHVLVHGYVGHVNFSGTAFIYKALLRRADSNVLVVDWGPLAAPPCYPAAVLNTLHAGRCTGALLVALGRRYPALRMRDVHAVGFSLGAHVAAFASNAVQDATGQSFGRITGLDPALPLFATLKKNWKLDASDAEFVDVLHTNVGVFGKIEAVGHADFYFNGGTVQPACTDHPNVPLCSHILANVYYAESIESEEGFWGRSCPSYYQYLMGWCSIFNSSLDKVIVGEPCNTSTRGVYFIETADSPPYALGPH